MKRKLLAFSLVIILVFMMTACTPLFDIEIIKEQTENFLDLVLADNYDSAYAMLQETVTPEDFKPYWDMMRTASEGATAYEMEELGWSAYTTNGITQYLATFDVTLDNGRTLFVQTTLIEGIDGISGIYFHETTEFNATYGTYAPIIHIILVVLSLLSIAFTVWMIIDCARRKMQKKALWIIIILLGITLSVTIGGQFGVNLGIGIFFMLSSATSDLATLSMTVKLIIPLGAILYFCLRKRLTVTPPTEQISENTAE